MKFYHIFISILLLSATAIFADCVGYTDSFDVRVLDGNLKPVEGAAVQVTYDRGASFGEQYFTTPVRYTDASGKVHYDIYNQGTLSRDIDCAIKINATIGGSSKKATVEANAHGPIVDLQISDLYILRFYVRDQLGAPLTNASVSVNGQTNKTDATGKVAYRFKTGTYEYFASYRNAYQPGHLTIQNESDFVVVFPFYKISIEATDDGGNPLPATLTIFNESFIMENGRYGLERAFGDEIPYSINYMGLVTEDVMIPSLDPMVEVRYDITSPLIKSITPDFVGNTYKLQIHTEDPNEFASGLDQSSVKVYYRVEPADAAVPWSNAIVFTAGKDLFTADFPELPESRLVKFRIELKDKAGNRAEQEGTFTTSAAPILTNDSESTQPPPEEEHGIPLIYIIGGVIVVISAIYLVFRIKSKAGGGA
ncbi:MAG: hypothetical protein AB1295_00300 [Candidatus Micrarchaeota archaeon]